MSSPYRYVVFEAGKQPTVEEVATLQKCVKLFKCRYTIGINQEDGSLTLVFEANSFQALSSTNRQFQKLLGHWQVRGSEVRERVLFIKQPTALQPMLVAALHLAAEQGSDSLTRSKQLAAKEALGRAGLALHRTLERQAGLTRYAKFVPYVLMFLVGGLTIAAGVYTGQRLLDSSGERRHETIQRVANDGMHEQLSAQATE